MSVYLVIFGAAVLPDGTPSGTLRRRVEGACAIAPSLHDPVYLATGGKGRHGPPEAEVIRDLLLGAGVPRDRILIEPTASDTLDSALRCDAILRRRGDAELVIPCSSNYHTPRCGLLMRLLGYRVARRRMPSDRPYLPVWKLGFYVLKECLALPYDAVLTMWWRITHIG